MAKFRAGYLLELVHGDLSGPIVLVMHGGRRYVLLTVDNCRRYTWLQLLMNKDKAAEVIEPVVESW